MLEKFNIDDEVYTIVRTVTKDPCALPCVIGKGKITAIRKMTKEVYLYTIVGTDFAVDRYTGDVFEYVDDLLTNFGSLIIK